MFNKYSFFYSILDVKTHQYEILFISESDFNPQLQFPMAKMASVFCGHNWLQVNLNE